MLVLHRARLLASNESVLALGVAPRRVVSRRCRCVVQRLCATDLKRPCLVRAAAPHSAPARMPGVYAQRLCRTQSLWAYTALHHGEKFISKTDFFSKLNLYQTVEKPLSLIKMGSQGRSPRQGLGAVAPHPAPARMPGVYAQRLCTMQSQQSIHSPSPRGRGLGIRQGCRDRTPEGFAGRKAHKAFL